ncbi:MAG TPA: tetratricopeptide repeat protein [Caldimonas sp.]|jgi:tetratricopeptide (TPR) repeat protein|nr:tetratricopeptide repeat protein [Caldimonas sp.]HEX2542936.1 tetratricopeptide repeat protein [Caldimonas sp.]
MTVKDLHGHALSGASVDAVEPYEQSLEQLRCYVGDPLGAVQAALAAAPAMTMAHVLVGYLMLAGTEPAGHAEARAAHARAAALPADEREAMHVAALGRWCQGRWFEAGRILEDLSARFPRDLLALQMGHAIDFFTGRSRMLRDRIARAESHWHDGMPGRHAVLSMLAFGLEENADYARAEKIGRRAVEIEPSDGWGWHAVAHVMEMQNRRADGIAWLAPNAPTWSEGSFFAVHNWWHLALFHLGLDHVDEALALLDQRVMGTASPVVLDMIDASAMLWRLQLRGVPVGERWSALAERWLAVSADSTYAFNDMHAMMAFVGADRMGDAHRLLAAQREALQRDDDNRIFLREVGAPATQAIHDFAVGAFADAAERLRQVRPVAHQFGGSHAQRDLIDLTLIEAATRAGDRSLADALKRERAFVRH